MKAIGAWSERLPRGQFWTYFCAALFFNFGFSVFFFLFNVYLVGLGHNERSLGFIGSWAIAGTFCGTLPAGMVAERFGVRWTLIVSISLAVLFCMLRVLLLADAAQFALAACAGFALCAWGVCLGPAVASLTSESQRSLGFSLMFASGIGDAGLGAYTAGHLPAWCAHLPALKILRPVQAERDVLLFGCAIAMIAIVPLSRLTVPAVDATSRRRFAFPSGGFLPRFLLASAVWAVVIGAFPPFASVFFTHHLGLSLQSMGGVLSLSQLVSFVAILLAPILFRRAGLANGILITQLLTATALFLLAGAHTLTQAAGVYWLYTAAQNSNEPGLSTLLMGRVAERDRATAASYTSFVTAGAQILASALLGASIVRFGYSVALYTIGLLALVAAVLYRRLPQAGAVKA